MSPSHRMLSGLVLAALAASCTPAPPVQPFLTRFGTGDAEKAKLYYQTIGAEPTLEEWIANRPQESGGIAGAPPVLSAEAQYFNDNDLRLGRDMNCWRFGSGRIACYVTNYGQPGGAPGAAFDAMDGGEVYATVAMDYRPANGELAVQFYVYDSDGRLAQNAVLDSQGNIGKYVPEICMSCHGGTLQGSRDDQQFVVRSASFLPFDVFTFEYDTAPGRTLAEQQEDFRRLNVLVADTQPHEAISDLINGMYSGDLEVPGSLPNDDWMPVGWVFTPKAELYEQVVKPSCRGCHIALQKENLDFASWLSFQASSGLIQSDVCLAYVMPHAEVTYQKFWQNLSRPLKLAEEMGYELCLFPQG